MTTLTYLGHACFLFETDAAAILIDPWLSPEGAFLGTWRQLPPNDHCLAFVEAKMKQKPVAIYVTHEHEDHYDEKTMRRLLPLAKALYIPDYENHFFKNLMVKNLGAAPQVLGEDAPEMFHDISFKIFIDESGINRDSAIFLKTPDLSFLDANDCKIFDRATFLLERCGPIDILSSQFSGANMHPICYDMPEESYREISRQKRMRKFVAVRNFIKDLKPRYYLPSAGPAVFPYPQHEALNFQEKNIFPKWWEFRDFLGGKADVEFVPLDVLGTATGAAGQPPAFAGMAKEITDAEIMDIIHKYRALDAALPKAAKISEAAIFAFFGSEMNKKIEVLKSNPKVSIDCTLFIDIRKEDGTDTLYCLKPGTLQLEKADKSAIAPPYYLHTTSTAALEKFIQSGKGWGTYFLSFLFRGKRDPDVFDTALGTFFVANDAADLDYGLKKLVEFRDSDEYITLEAPDGKSSVSCRRFCPHQGADLTYANFDGKYVICPRHQWRFNCENGGKADNSNDTLDATITKKQ
ncbi:MAG: MBL fold metallo-hydrolase [Micavibrio sp.]|nr:MBL fold metallo-hydrolase [Micavibrio sp.]